MRQRGAQYKRSRSVLPCFLLYILFSPVTFFSPRLLIRDYWQGRRLLRHVDVVIANRRVSVVRRGPLILRGGLLEDVESIRSVAFHAFSEVLLFHTNSALFSIFFFIFFSCKKNFLHTSCHIFLACSCTRPYIHYTLPYFLFRSSIFTSHSISFTPSLSLSLSLFFSRSLPLILPQFHKDILGLCARCKFQNSLMNARTYSNHSAHPL